MADKKKDKKKPSKGNRFWRGVRKTIKWFFICFFVSSFLAVLTYKWVTRTEHQWVPLEEMSPNLPLAVWASEDQNFFKHFGFDFEAIQMAYDEAKEGKRQRGASTISQQTAKNVFLWPQSSWVRKGFEAYFTLLIELLWSKDRIMEVYLNSIEMGDGIYGAEAVAKAHFGTSAKNLTREQCALIAATLPNPIKYNSARPSPYVYKRQRAILRQMKNLGKYPFCQ